jgi:hypothetical protein
MTLNPKFDPNPFKDDWVDKNKQNECNWQTLQHALQIPGA